MSSQTYYISYLRIFATIAVVLIHASTGYLNGKDFYAFDWNYANILNSFSRLSVPLFVLISGALLLPKAEEPLAFYQKRLVKLIPIFFFWNMIYILYYFFKYPSLQQYDLNQKISYIAEKMKSGANAHLWYLYLLPGLYLAIPFIHKLLKSCSKKDIEIFLILWYISLFLFNKRLSPYLPNFDLGFFTGYFGYLVLGYYLRIYNFNSRLFAYMIVCTATAIGTFYLSLQQQRFDSLLYGYLAPNTVWAAAFLFVTFKNKLNTAPVPKYLSWIDKYSFGIYLSHILFLNYIHPAITFSSAWKIPIATLLTLGCSALCCMLLRKIPFGKYISG